MLKILSQDLRVRVIAAVEDGLSRHGAGARFGVGGAIAGKRRGGDRHSARIEARGSVILAAIEAQVEITLVELAELLEREHGERFAPSKIWRFLDRQ